MKFPGMTPARLRTAAALLVALCAALPARTQRTETPVAPEDLEGLFDQISRNTRYLFGPEEILADNFAQLAVAEARHETPRFNSPGIIERVRKILLE